MNNPIANQYSQDHPKRDVAVIGLRDQQGEILLVRTHKLPEWWQPVGGGVDPDDASPEEAVIRELQEETGITLNPAELHLTTTTSYDFGEGMVYFFEALVDRDNLEMKVDTVEIIDYQWFTIEESLKLPVFAATAQFLQKLSKTQ